MKKFLQVIILLLFSYGCSSTKENLRVSVPFSITGKKVTIYTTADKTNLRLTLTDTLSFQKEKPPVETEEFVFVNPEKTYQTFLGIGGAITDASAEVFAKLPLAKQQELLTSLQE